MANGWIGKFRTSSFTCRSTSSRIRRTSSSPFPFGSSSGQSSRLRPGTNGHSSPQPMVMSRSASWASSLVSFCGFAEVRSKPASRITCTTSGWTLSTGCVPAEIARAFVGSAYLLKNAAPICERPALCTQAKMTFCAVISQLCQFWQSFLPRQPIQIELLDRFVLRLHQVTDTLPRNQMTYFFGHILGVIAGALQGCGHLQNVEALLALETFRTIRVSHQQKIAEAVHLRISAQHLKRQVHVAFGKCLLRLGQHIFQHARHSREVIEVLHINACPDDRTALSKCSHQITRALQVNHQLHARQQHSGLGRTDLRNRRGKSLVEFAIKAVQALLTFLYGLEGRF